ncbi:MAG: transposase [Verrucomicrobia bacterium]|nr:transposase [Verrucomicrobiota bacterium]
MMKFFNPQTDTKTTHHKLPHWQQDNVAIFVTFRLADSLPKQLLDSWLTAREAFLTSHPKPWDDTTEAIFHAQFSDKLDEYLNAGHGCCALRDSVVAKIVADRFHRLDDQRYLLWSYVIMPNHAHVLFTPESHAALPAIIGGWKGVSSRLIHKAGLSALNPFWQPEYFDRLVRSPEHFEMIRTYIRENPAKAGLKAGFILWEQG